MAILKTLFIASPLGFDADYTFTRSSVAKRINENGVMEDVAANVLRVDYIDLDGGTNLITPTFLLEPARTNLTDEDDLTNWSVTGTPVLTPGISDPELGTNAFTVADNDGASVEFISRTVTYTGDAIKGAVIVVRENTMPASGVQSIKIRDDTAGVGRLVLEISAWVEGKPTVSATTGTLLGQRYVGRGYWAIYAQTTSVTAANTNVWQILPADTSSETGSIDVFRANTYDAVVPAFSILDESDVKDADTLFFDFAAVPQELTMYLKFAEIGTASQTAINHGKLHVGSSVQGGDPRLDLKWNGATTSYRIEHDNAVASVTSDGASSPSFADLVELRATVSRDGAVQLGQVLNGGAEVTGSLSGINALAEAWADTRVYINSQGTAAVGFGSYLEIKIAAGTKTMAEMQSLNPFFGLLTSAIPVAQDSVDGERQEIGDKSRTFDGTMRQTIRSRVSNWSGSTVPLTQADKSEVQDLLESSTQPQGSFGEMVAGSTGDFPNLFTSVTDISPIQSGTARRYVISFTAEESS